MRKPAWTIPDNIVQQLMEQTQTNRKNVIKALILNNLDYVWAVMSLLT
jgi:NACalpha-BTF3-like transcription factor